MCLICLMFYSFSDYSHIESVWVYLVCPAPHTEGWHLPTSVLWPHHMMKHHEARAYCFSRCPSARHSQWPLVLRKLHQVALVFPPSPGSLPSLPPSRKSYRKPMLRLRFLIKSSALRVRPQAIYLSQVGMGSDGQRSVNHKPFSSNSFKRFRTKGRANQTQSWKSEILSWLQAPLDPLSIRWCFRGCRQFSSGRSSIPK